jgi:hypothetical protein
MAVVLGYHSGPQMPDEEQRRMSQHEHVIDDLVSPTGHRTPSKLIAEVEHRMLADGREGFARVPSADNVRADRDAH